MTSFRFQQKFKSKKKKNLDVSLCGVLFIVCCNCHCNSVVCLSQRAITASSYSKFFPCNKPPYPRLDQKEKKLQRDKGTKGQMDKGTKGQRVKGTKGQRDKGIKGQRDKGATFELLGTKKSRNFLWQQKIL